MRIGSLTAELDDLIAAVFAEHGNMYVTGWESQFTLQPGIDAIFVEAPNSAAALSMPYVPVLACGERSNWQAAPSGGGYRLDVP